MKWSLIKNKMIEPLRSEGNRTIVWNMTMKSMMFTIESQSKHHRFMVISQLVANHVNQDITEYVPSIKMSNQTYTPSVYDKFIITENEEIDIAEWDNDEIVGASRIALFLGGELIQNHITVARSPTAYLHYPTDIESYQVVTMSSWKPLQKLRILT